MAKKLYLIRLGEISLKGQNRDSFERKLKNNIKIKLRPYHSTLVHQKGRFFFYFDEETPDAVIDFALGTTFGVVGYSKAYCCEKSMEEVEKTVCKVIESEPFKSFAGSFKVETRREDKSFELNSYELSCLAGGWVLDRMPSLKVDVKHPDHVLFIEIREKAYVYCYPENGPGGLPTGIAGKGLCLLSGGIDSPVAAYKMAKRGLKQDCLYFHAPPYTSEAALEKVKTLACKLSGYLQGLKLHVVPFTEAELWIRDHSNEEEHTLMMRCAMMKVAQAIAQREKCSALVTGEALSQVASQTLAAMSFTDSCTDMLVLRPLVGDDKQEIINVARKIGTYETSILPFEDCCVIFSPKHPLVRPDKATERESFERMGIEPILKKAIEETVAYEMLPTASLVI
ncbi:MAG: tRNA uracil 4-sulfurtransferase ThiI [Sphaerochaetaceae bacterium]